MKMKLTSIPLVALLVLAGCSSGGSTQPEQTGGHGGSGSGGDTHAGGSSGQGGTKSTGGTTSNGGSSGVAGTVAAGGSGSGGASSTGGKSVTGGAGSGGAPGTGGESPRTGGMGAGGTTAQGGTAASGGAGSGGVSAPGGSTGKDGGPGDTKGTGGASGAGGSSAITITASGYPAAGASGQAAPTGTGSKVNVVDWAGFKGAVSFTFDDANQSQIDNYAALQKLNDKGNNARFTFYLQTGKTQASDKTWAQAQKDGHELGNHTKSHQQTGTAADIEAAETFIKSTFGVTAYSLAAPYGDGSYATLAVGKFLTNRSAGNSGNWIAMSDDPDKSSLRYNLPCYIPAEGAAASAVISPVADGKWAVILVHGFDLSKKDGSYQPVAITEFTSGVSSVKTKGTIWIDAVANVSSYWIAGYKFSKLTATTSGSDKTWTWKTSDFSPTFPPGKYLRVTTDGGTLKQGSTTLAWDDHGYYEVSLDAGTLTLSQ